MSSNNIQQLTGFRALAAFAVFFSHFPIIGSSGLLQGTLSQGYIGVTLFYVLSGFLIAYNYFHTFDGSTRWYRHFLWQRVARIYPVYLLILVTTAIALTFLHLTQTDTEFFTHPFTWWFLQLTFLKGYFTDYNFTGIPQAWSLTVEFTFYIVAPLIFFLFFKKIKWLTTILIYAFGLILMIISIHLGFHHFLGNFNLFWFYSFFGRCFEFIIGMLLAINLSNLDWLRRTPAKTYIGLFLIILIEMLLYICRGNHLFGFYTNFGMLLMNWLLPVAVTLFVAGLIFENNFISWFLSTRLMQLLGKASYTFYLLQFLVMAFVINDYRFRIAEPHHLWVILIGFSLTNLIAIFIYIYYEKPIHRFLVSQKPTRVISD